MGKFDSELLYHYNTQIMEINQDIKQLAFQYFRGKISPKDESRLYEFVKENDLNEKKFREWEQEWIKEESSNLSKDEWNSVERHLFVSGTIQNNKMTLSKKKPLWIIPAAAAVAILLICSIITVKYFAKPQPTYFTTEAPKGERSRLVLPDGTRVLLNSGSKLKYSNDFSNNNRNVELIGEGYFEVSKKDNNTFIVHTRAYDVVVRGTKFNIAAYPEDSLITTTLMEGKVELNYQNEIITMHPGQTLALNVKTNKINSLSKRVSQASAWIDNRIEYDDITLKQLVSILSMQYDVNITIKNKKLEEKTFSISLRNNESIQQIIDGISGLVDAKVIYNKNEIILK